VQSGDAVPSPHAIPAEPAKDLKDATEGSVEKGEGHGLGILDLPRATEKILVLSLDEVTGTDRTSSVTRRRKDGGTRAP
jgi:hypothetical protein